MNDKIFKALNEQIKMEIYSSHLYLSISSYFASIPLDGFAKWFRKQGEEELEHAMKIYDYIIDRNMHVDFPAIDKPAVKFKSIPQIFEMTLEHEQKVTKSIHNIYELAGKEKDFATQVFLHWFISEQVEEEKNAQDNLDQVNFIGDDKSAYLVLDQDLARKVT